MPTSATIYDCVFVPQRVALPDACPNCGADFHSASNLREWDATEVQFTGFLSRDPDQIFEVKGEDDRGDDFHPVAYYCASCNELIVEAHTLHLDDTHPAFRLARAVIDPPPRAGEELPKLGTRLQQIAYLRHQVRLLRAELETARAQQPATATGPAVRGHA